MSTIEQWLLLAGGEDGNSGTGRAVRLINDRFGSGVYVQRIEVMTLEGAAELRRSAELGVGVGYRQLWQAGYLRQELSTRFRVEGLDTHVCGHSGDLLFALAVINWACCKGSAIPAFAATGTLTERGDVGTVTGLPVKLDAALRVLGPGGVIFYPKENESEIGGELLARAKAGSVQLLGIQHLAEAARALGVDIPLMDQPYRGLQPFEEKHRSIYFGRQPDIDGICEQLVKRERAQQPGLLLLAASGAGKTSLLQAGILPSLRIGPNALTDKPLVYRVWRLEQASAADEATLVETIRASWSTLAGFDALRDSKPVSTFDALLAKLPEALQQGQIRFIWVIDQLEQAFRLPSKDTTRAFTGFMRKLHQRGAWVIGALRGDFYPSYLDSADLLEMYPSSGTEVSGIYNLTAPNIQALDQIITGPADVAELRFEIDRETGIALNTQIRDDMGSHTTALPQLQVALKKLYDERDKSKGLLLRSHYAGLDKAIGIAAHDAIQDLDNAARDALPTLFQALADTRSWHGESSSLAGAPKSSIITTARVTDLSQWPQESAVRRLAERLRERWLLTGVESDVDGQSFNRVKVVHESLLSWGEAKKALDNNLSALLLRSRLHDRAMLWDASGRIQDRLLHTGLELEEATHLHAEHRELLDATIDREFVEQSINTDALVSQQRKQAEDAEKQRRWVVKKQTISWVLAAALFAAGLIGAFAFRFELSRAWAQYTAARQKSTAELAALAHKAAFNECNGVLNCPEMVVLEGGKFIIGSATDEVGRFDDEGPQHLVVVPRFAMGKYDVTFDEWSTCIAYTNQEELEKQRGANAPLVGCAPTTDSGFGGRNRPVINVSWDDAQGYVSWLNLMLTGSAHNGPYRLSSEAEWEYAARAGSSAAYFWGSDPSRLCEYANIMTRETKTKYPTLQGQLDEAPACEEPFVETSPVGSFKPNPFGLYDMYGDVWQWLEDCYRPYAAGGADANETSSACPLRVLRGASWRQTPRNLRSARRGKYAPGSRYFDVGLRLARDL